MRLKKFRLRPSTKLFLSLVLIHIFFLPAILLSQPAFYQGKTITIIQGRDPGGLGPLRMTALMPFLQKHIPGNPHIVTEYMPGGGGRKAANHLYRSVRSDGLTIGNIGAGFVANAILGEPGVQYDIDKFIYLGSGNSVTSYVFLSKKELGLNTLERLRAASGLRVGAQSVGHDIYIMARLFSWLLDIKDPKFVTGYSGPELDVALLRGEIDLRTTVTYNLLKQNPDWAEKGLMDFHVIIEIPRGLRAPHARFAKVPELETFAKTDIERKVLQLIRNLRLIGSPSVLPAGTPKDRVELLQEAFRKAYKDPQFHESWRNITGEPTSPLMPEEQEKAIKEIPRDREVIDLAKRLAGAVPLPPR